MTNNELLGLKIQTNDFDEITVAEFFAKLLQALWHEGEGFSGKRPFGNSGWEYDLARAIGVAGGFPVVNVGSNDEPEWDLEDEDAAMKAIASLLRDLVLSCPPAP